MLIDPTCPDGGCATTTWGPTLLNMGRQLAHERKLQSMDRVRELLKRGLYDKSSSPSESEKSLEAHDKTELAAFEGVRRDGMSIEHSDGDAIQRVDDAGPAGKAQMPVLLEQRLDDASVRRGLVVLPGPGGSLSLSLSL